MTRISTVSILALSASFFWACAPAPTVERPAKKNSAESGNQTPDPGGKTTETSTPEPGDDPNPPGDEPKIPETEDPGTQDPPVDPMPSLNFTGGIEVDNAFVRTGEITGWAVDKENLKNYLSVNIYFDGDNKSGVKAGTTKANLVGVDDNNGGEHAFIFKVPSELINSKAKKVYAYALVEGVEVPLSDKMPYEMTFYRPKGGSAQAKYNETGIQNNCGGCHHRFSYTDRWDKLVQDGFSGKPWSETTNYFYEKVATPMNHKLIRGSQPCSLINCDKIKDWWRLEFAP